MAHPDHEHLKATFDALERQFAAIAALPAHAEKTIEALAPLEKHSQTLAPSPSITEAIGTGLCRDPHLRAVREGIIAAGVQLGRMFSSALFPQPRTTRQEGKDPS